MIHHAGVGQQRFGRHRLLAAGDHGVQFVEVGHQQRRLARFRRQAGEHRFAEAFAHQIVDGQLALGRDECRFIAFRAIAAAGDCHAALARHDERRQLFVAVLVFDDDVRRREDVGDVIGREIAVAQEARSGYQFANRHQKIMGLVNIQHFRCSSFFLSR